jgi:hypothetical protein
VERLPGWQGAERLLEHLPDRTGLPVAAGGGAGRDAGATAGPATAPLPSRPDGSGEGELPAPQLWHLGAARRGLDPEGEGLRPAGAGGDPDRRRHGRGPGGPERVATAQPPVMTDVGGGSGPGDLARTAWTPPEDAWTVAQASQPAPAISGDRIRAIAKDVDDNVRALATATRRHAGDFGLTGQGLVNLANDALARARTLADTAQTATLRERQDQLLRDARTSLREAATELANLARFVERPADAMKRHSEHIRQEVEKARAVADRARTATSGTGDASRAEASAGQLAAEVEAAADRIHGEIASFPAQRLGTTPADQTPPELANKTPAELWMDVAGLVRGAEGAKQLAESGSVDQARDKLAKAVAALSALSDRTQEVAGELGADGEAILQAVEQAKGAASAALQALGQEPGPDTQPAPGTPKRDSSLQPEEPATREVTGSSDEPEPEHRDADAAVRAEGEEALEPAAPGMSAGGADTGDRGVSADLGDLGDLGDSVFSNSLLA